MQKTITIAHIEKFFSSYQPKRITNSKLTRAGVLILLIGNDENLSILFTKRTETVEHHKGQISFPGGAQELSDIDIVGTALRETEEEIGLLRSFIRILGIADDFETPSGFCITPVIGHIALLPDLLKNEDEVSEIFTVPISFFLDPKNEHIEQRQISGTLKTIYYYQYRSYSIWGATAAILRQWLHSLNASSL